ncbi:MAG TPA: glycosyltransferase family 39 protein, partial [Pirellulales bacterium]
MQAKLQSSVHWARGFVFSWWLVSVLLAGHFLLGVSAVHRKSPTFDEGVHLAGGFSYWVTNDYRVNSESGNWPQRWMALPAWLLGDYYPPPDEPTWIKDDRYDFADRILYESGNDADSMIFQGRVMTGLLSVALGAIVYFWSRQLFGALGGLISLTLYAFSPTILANGFLMTTDLAAALFFSAAMWTWWTLLHRISVLSLVLAGFSVAGLLLSKFSGVLIFPMILLLLAIRLLNDQPLHWAVGRRREINGRLKQLAVFSVVLLVQAAMIDLIIWGSYGFRYSMLNPAAGENQNLDHPLDRIPAEFGLIVPVTKYLGDRGLLPEPFLYGFACTVAKAEIRRSSMNGQFSTHGQFVFFPYCLAVKTPVEVFVILFLAAWGAWFWRVQSKNTDPKKEQTSWFELSWTGRMYALAPVLVLLGVYWTVSLASHLNIGQRHLLPTYPPMFILAGVAACWLQSIPKPPTRPVATKRGKANAVEAPERTNRLIVIARVLLIGGLLLSALEAVWIWPDYLAYFNFLAGGPANGYRHLVDSSLDWGQDLKELKSWLARESKD